jgi:hypothetical protein
MSPLVSHFDLTTDHSAYNPKEVRAVIKRSKNARGAISSSVGGGIKRVAGSLSVTRALGDAYLKTPLLSFHPYKRHSPYITARPEIKCRLVDKRRDRFVVLASDGVWEKASGSEMLRWIGNYYNERLDGSAAIRDERADRSSHDSQFRGAHVKDESDINVRTKEEAEDAAIQVDTGIKNTRRTFLRGYKRKKSSNRSSITSTSSVSDVIVRRVLNKVKRSRNIGSLRDLMSLPRGRARRCRHDDITACVVDLGGFIS